MFLARPAFLVDLVDARRDPIQIAAQLPKRDADVAAIEAELATARAEQKRLAKAIAMADDVPELVSELKKRSVRIAHLEVPDPGGEAHARRSRPADREDRSVAPARSCTTSAPALADQRDLREVFLTLFPEGLTFTPARSAGQLTLRSGGSPDPRASVVWWTEVGPDCVATPTGFEPVLPA